MFKQQSNMKIT